MKAGANTKVEIDWMVHAVMEHKSDRNKPEKTIDYVTSGFANHGFDGEVMVVGKVKNAEEIANLINIFCRMMIEGEKFDPNCTHTIDDMDGNPKFKFNVYEYQTLNGDVKYQLIPYYPEHLIFKG